LVIYCSPHCTLSPLSDPFVRVQHGGAGSLGGGPEHGGVVSAPHCTLSPLSGPPVCSLSRAVVVSARSLRSWEIALTFCPKGSTSSPRCAVSASSSSSSGAFRPSLVPMRGMQTGLGTPKLVDAADQSSSFVRLYCSVGMPLANIVECWSLLAHAMYTGLAGCRALIFKSSLSALAFTTCLHNVFWVCASRIPSTELPARSGGQLSGVSICVGSSLLPSSASCWHVAQFTSKASLILVCRDKRGSKTLQRTRLSLIGPRC
jgi:hypothetical protein